MRHVLCVTRFLFKRASFRNEGRDFNAIPNAYLSRIDHVQPMKQPVRFEWS